MADRSFDRIARDLASDFSSLRDDLRKLTNAVTDLATDQADEGRGTLMDAVGKARGRFSDTADRFSSQASYVTDRATRAQAELGSRIEKNPLTAVMIAVVGGLVIGALSRSRK